MINNDKFEVVNGEGELFPLFFSNLTSISVDCNSSAFFVSNKVTKRSSYLIEISEINLFIQFPTIL